MSKISTHFANKNSSSNARHNNLTRFLVEKEAQEKKELKKTANVLYGWEWVVGKKKTTKTSFIIKKQYMFGRERVTDAYVFIFSKFNVDYGQTNFQVSILCEHWSGAVQAKTFFWFNPSENIVSKWYQYVCVENESYKILLNIHPPK